MLGWQSLGPRPKKDPTVLAPTECFNVELSNVHKGLIGTIKNVVEEGGVDRRAGRFRGETMHITSDCYTKLLPADGMIAGCYLAETLSESRFIGHYPTLVPPHSHSRTWGAKSGRANRLKADALDLVLTWMREEHAKAAAAPGLAPPRD